MDNSQSERRERCVYIGHHYVRLLAELNQLYGIVSERLEDAYADQESDETKELIALHLETVRCQYNWVWMTYCFLRRPTKVLATAAGVPFHSTNRRRRQLMSGRNEICAFTHILLFGDPNKQKC